MDTTDSPDRKSSSPKKTTRPRRWRKPTPYPATRPANYWLTPEEIQALRDEAAARTRRFEEIWAEKQKKAAEQKAAEEQESKNE